MSAVPTITTDRFEAEVLNSPVPVLVDFYADWCPPCKALAPVLEALAPQVAGEARVVKVHVEHEPALAEAFEVRSIPTLVVIADGEVVQRATGFASEAQLRQMLRDAGAVLA